MTQLTENNVSAIEALSEVYGSRLELLTEKHKLFILGTVALSLYGSHSIGGAIDELDPDAQFLESFIVLVEGLERQSKHELLMMIAAIANQLIQGNHQ